MPTNVTETPDWVPSEALRYIEHVACGRPIRAIARERGVHASTILRQVRKTEERREDVLVDMALERLHATAADLPRARQGRTGRDVALIDAAQPLPDDQTMDAEALRVLTRLNEPGACLAIARDMEKAVVVRNGEDGAQLRTAIVDRAVAEALALKDWIETTGEGRVSRYRITGAGRLALRRLVELSGDHRKDPFATGHRAIGTGEMEDDTGRRRRQRYAAAESPLLALSRRRDKAGTPFLEPDLVAAGERLREDFELAQVKAIGAQDWHGVMAGDVPGLPSRNAGQDAARGRLVFALSDLGPGLGDVALRCCCYLEGLESVERSLGWSARSGKIVLRIALTRLKRHYDEQGPDLRMIG